MRAADVCLSAKNSTERKPKARSEHMKEFEWSSNKETAALLLAEDSLSIPQIANQLHVNESTIDRWKQHPQFKARIEENVAAFRVRMLEYGLARKENRIAALSDLFRRQQLILTERGQSLEMQSVPGGTSGLVCTTWKQLGGGEDAQLVPEHTADTGLSREIRGTLEQVAVELGQRIQKHEVAGKNGGPIQVAPAKLDLSKLSNEELVALESIAQRVRTPAASLLPG